MSIIASAIDTRSPAFQANAAAMRALIDDLHAVVQRIKQGGDERARGVILRGASCCRASACAGCSTRSPFLELSQLARTACTTTRCRARIITGSAGSWAASA